MDKKNTMLLTVIAVATLLVAVVGATFAYFSVSGSGTSTTNIRAGIENIGTIALSTGGDHPHLNVSAEDMSVSASQAGDKTYYSTILSDGLNSDHRDTPTPDVFATAKLTGGDENVKYKCTATFKVTVKENTQISNIEFEQGDAVLTLSADEGVNLGDLSSPIDLSTLKQSEYSKSSQVTFDFVAKNKGDSVEVEKSIKGYLAITNKKKDESNQNADQTSRLAGKSFTVEIVGNNFSCDIAPAGE